MQDVSLLFLSQEEVIECDGLNMSIILQDIENFFSLEVTGKTIIPSKTILRWGDVKSEETKGRINCMPAYVGGDVNMAGIKWIGSAPLNPLKYNLPRASALTILNDPDKLFPVAVMDGTLISAMRTGAVTGVGAKYLARNDSEIVGLIGAGVQNKTQLMALNEVLNYLKKVIIYDKNKQRAFIWAKDMSEKYELNIEVGDTIQKTIENADVVVTATTSVEPVIREDWFKEGCFYAQVGGNECTPEVILNFDKFVVDNWEEVLHRGIFTIAHIYNKGKFKKEELHASIGEIVIKKKPGRENNKERILFSPIGMGAEDITVASRIYIEALKRGIGTKLNLWKEPFAW
ncbi:ornithine cyclodeaminase [Candidatus Atribacteria bacterium HGW-Atribacteria-1]|nr:MAG: ornithine cyclodeaminase [Candidatus Atribacteria bacterium HGW-Atribacteria-1]